MNIDDKFAALVQMLQRDLASIQARLQRLEAAQQSRALNGIDVERYAPGSAETTMTHPLTGQSVKVNQVDPKLAWRMRFSEED